MFCRTNYGHNSWEYYNLTSPLRVLPLSATWERAEQLSEFEPWELSPEPSVTVFQYCVHEIHTTSCFNFFFSCLASVLSWIKSSFSCKIPSSKSTI